MPDTASFPPMTARPQPSDMAIAGETVRTNGVDGPAALTLCVPCYREGADALIEMMTRMSAAARAAIIFYDDGTNDPALTVTLADGIQRLSGPAMLVTASRNAGRSHARNRLVELAQTDWILFLDADMRPDDDQFLERYLDAMRQLSDPALIAGGFSLQHVTPRWETALHAAQSRMSECLDAETRSRAAGRYVFTSNILVHRDVLNAVAFDDGFAGWGWEDVDWGLNVAGRFPVLHIDNPATHLGLDTTDALLEKFGGSGQNFARLAARHPRAVQSMPLYRMARRFRALPARTLFRALARLGARTDWLPLKLRLACLKTFRALAYSEFLK